MKRLAWICNSTSNFSRNAFALLFLIFWGMGLTACNQFQAKELTDTGPVEAEAAKEKAVQIDDPEGESVLLADEGEELLAPQTLDQAKEKFRQAVELDKDNGRARFWLEWIKALGETKGIVNRIRPIYEKVPGGALRYAMLTNEMDRRLTPSFRRFLLDGPQDIATMDEFQEWIDRMLLRLSELRSYIKTNKHKEIRVRIPTNFIASLGIVRMQGNRREVKNCETANFGPVTLKLGSCAFKDVALNRADFEALQQLVAYYEVFFSTLNSYRINPTLFAKRGELSLEEGLKELMKEGFGTLRSGKNRLLVVRDITSDFTLALQYFIDHQKEACKKGYPSKSNRPGYLIETGFCLSLDSEGKAVEERTVSILEKLIAGEAFSSYMMFADDGELTQHEVAYRYVTGTNYVHWATYPLKFIENPPQDLRDVLEFKHNPRQCTRSILSEKGMAPYMVNGRLGDMGVTFDRCEFREDAPSIHPEDHR